MNQHHIAGRIGNVKDLFRFNDGNAVLNFSVATTESWKDKQTNERKEVTDWHNCVLRGPRAEGLASHLRKGLSVSICGRSVTREYDKNGQTHRSTEIQVRELTIHWPPKEEHGGQRVEQQQQQPPQLRSGYGGPGDVSSDFTGGGGSPMDADDIPFAP